MALIGIAIVRIGQWPAAEKIRLSIETGRQKEEKRTRVCHHRDSSFYRHGGFSRKILRSSRVYRTRRIAGLAAQSADTGRNSSPHPAYCQGSGLHGKPDARSLVMAGTEAIGVVVTSIADPFNGEVVQGLEEEANHHGYSVILANSQADPEREMTVVRSFRERRVDGIVVASYV